MAISSRPATHVNGLVRICFVLTAYVKVIWMKHRFVLAYMIYGRTEPTLLNFKKQHWTGVLYDINKNVLSNTFLKISLCVVSFVSQIVQSRMWRKSPQSWSEAKLINCMLCIKCFKKRIRLNVTLVNQLIFTRNRSPKYHIVLRAELAQRVSVTAVCSFLAPFYCC